MRTGCVNSLVSVLMELDVTEQRQAHKQDQRRVQQDQSRLGDMRIIYRPQANIQSESLSTLVPPPPEEDHSGNSPNKTKHALNAATTTGYPDSLMIPKITGIVADPMRATNPLILVYGTYHPQRISVNTPLRIIRS